MDLYTQRDLPHVWHTIQARLTRGDIGIFPTDTIYGLSGNALDERVVARILRIKKRRRPVSFIPHAREWARLLMPPALGERFQLEVDAYTGPYTTLWPFD